MTKYFTHFAAVALTTGLLLTGTTAHAKGPGGSSFSGGSAVHQASNVQASNFQSTNNFNSNKITTTNLVTKQRRRTELDQDHQPQHKSERHEPQDHEPEYHQHRQQADQLGRDRPQGQGTRFDEQAQQHALEGQVLQG